MLQPFKNHRKSLILAGLFLLLANPSRAAGPVFSISGGLSYTAGPGSYESYWRSAFAIGGGVGYPVASFIMPMVFVDYVRFHLDPESYERYLTICRMDYPNCYVDAGSLSFTTVSTAVKFFIPRGQTRFSPYAKPGFGYVRGVREEVNARYVGDITDNYPSLPTVDILEEDTVDAMFFTLGLGFDYYMTPKAAVFIETQVTVGLTEERGTGYIPINVGMFFSL